MAMEPKFSAGLFDGESERPRSERVVRRLARACFWSNVDWLEEHPETPRLYDLIRAGKMVYRPDPPGVEDWAIIPVTMERGFGDCKKLACWLAAELFVGACHTRPDMVQAGFRAYPKLLNPVAVDRVSGGKLTVYHYVVDCTVPYQGRMAIVRIDPSLDAGMESVKPPWA